MAQYNGVRVHPGASNTSYRTNDVQKFIILPAANVYFKYMHIVHSYKFSTSPKMAPDSKLLVYAHAHPCVTTG